MVECNLAKVDVEGSNPFSRSQARPRAAGHRCKRPEPPLRLHARKNAAISLEPLEPPRFFLRHCRGGQLRNVVVTVWPETLTRTFSLQYASTPLTSPRIRATSPRLVS